MKIAAAIAVVAGSLASCSAMAADMAPLKNDMIEAAENWIETKRQKQHRRHAQSELRCTFYSGELGDFWQHRRHFSAGLLSRIKRSF
jgi:hypothetical protein